MNTNQKAIQAILDLATVADHSEGMSWYRRANDAATRMASQYGIHAETVAAVIAALSPRNKWDRNLVDAENLINIFQAGGAEEAANVKVCTFNKNKAKAIEILLADCLQEEAKAILSGPKLVEFYSCILGQDDVCIDGHAYSIWLGDRITLANVPSIGKKLRQQIKADYISVADRNDLRPYEVQAITWVTHRRIHGVSK